MMKLGPAKRNGMLFENPVPTTLGGLKLMLSLLPQYISNRAETTPRQALGPFRTDASVYEREPESGLRVTWFGHSSLLVEIDGVRLLVDPVWDLRAGPNDYLGPKRFFSPTLTLAELPAIDAVLISHDHYDHLGRQTVQHIAKAWPEMRWITSARVGGVLRKFGVAAERLTELDWTESTIVRARTTDAELKVTALPARHFSGRTLRTRFHTLWSSFVLAGSQHKVFYGADSGYWEGFETIGADYGPFDLSMLEVGAFHPKWKEIHLGPEGAVRAFQALSAGHPGDGGLFMPIHWGLFNLALHGWREPIEQATELADEASLRVFSPPPGTPTEVVEGQEVRSGWWRRQE